MLASKDVSAATSHFYEGGQQNIKMTNRSIILINGDPVIRIDDKVWNR